MRRLISSFVVIGALTAVGAPPAAADAPFVKELPAAACNQGTMNAHASVPRGTPGHPHIPHAMMGFCMTMPGAHP